MTEWDKGNSEADRCPYYEVCGIIQNHQDKLPGLINRFKQSYCFKNHHLCSRRWIKDFLGIEKVPELMMPQQHGWAEQLLFESGVRYADFQAKYRMMP